MRRNIFVGAITALFVSFLPMLAAYAAAPGDVLVATGTVRDGAGQPLGAKLVGLFAWPSAQVLDGLQPGAAVPTTLLATTTTSSAGQYSLYVAPAALQAAAVSGPNANLEVDAGTGKPWFFVADTANPVTATVNIASTSHAVSAAGRLGLRTPEVTWCTWIYQYQLNRD